MTEPTTTEPNPMAKTQKSMVVPTDLYRLVEYFENRTGVTFTRQAVAALLQYYLSDPNGPDPRWMEAAVALEKGHITVGDVGPMVARVKHERAASYERVVKATLAKGGHTPEQVDRAAEHAGATTLDAHNLYVRLMDVIRDKDDPIQAILDHWAQRDAQYVKLDEERVDFDNDPEAVSLSFNPRERPTAPKNKRDKKS